MSMKQAHYASRAAMRSRSLTGKATSRPLRCAGLQCPSCTAACQSSTATSTRSPSSPERPASFGSVTVRLNGDKINDLPLSWWLPGAAVQIGRNLGTLIDAVIRGGSPPAVFRSAYRSCTKRWRCLMGKRLLMASRCDAVRAACSNCDNLGCACQRHRVLETGATVVGTSILRRSTGRRAAVAKKGIFLLVGRASRRTSTRLRSSSRPFGFVSDSLVRARCSSLRESDGCTGSAAG